LCAVQVRCWCARQAAILISARGGAVTAETAAAASASVWLMDDRGQHRAGDIELWKLSQGQGAHRMGKITAEFIADRNSMRNRTGYVDGRSRGVFCRTVR